MLWLPKFSNGTIRLLESRLMRRTPAPCSLWDRKETDSVFNKRLISMVPQAMRYILRNVAAQWAALVANIVLMLLIGLFLQRLFDGIPFLACWVIALER